MTNRRVARGVFGLGFVLLLLDGAAAIWLGQLSGRGILVGVGLSLVLAAAGLVFAYRRWMAAMDAVDAVRRDLHQEIARLRDAAQDARAGRKSF